MRLLITEDAGWVGSVHVICEGYFKGPPVIKYTYLACLNGPS